MKRALILLIDLVIVFSGIYFSYNILGESNLILDYENNIAAFYIIAPLVGLTYIILMYAFGLYNSTRLKLNDVIYTVFLISISLMVSIMAICFFVRGGAMSFPRSVIFLSAVLYWALLTPWRILVWKMDRKSHGVKDITVIGPEAESLVTILRAKYKDIYRICRICREQDEEALPLYIKKSDELFLSSGLSSQAREKILFTASQQGVGVHFVPEYQDISIMSSSIQKTDDIPTYYIEEIGLKQEERFVKRMVDLILGGIGFILAFPLALVTALVVKLDGGPIFYTQERLTRDGKVFKVFKFRTMVPDAEKLSGPVLAGENDPRITKTGKFMRAMRLDEIPQILNILNGEMSIVGPRPERLFFTEQFEEKIPQYRQRLKVKAGLTGLAQVEGKYNTSFEDKLRYDLVYINNYSLFQDFLIILQTIKILFMKESTEGVCQTSPIAEEKVFMEINN